MNDYGRRIVIDSGFEAAVGEVNRAIRDEGMQTIAQVDVRDSFRRDLARDFRRYMLFEAWSPDLAFDALRNDLDAGTIFPTTIAIYELADGETAIMAKEPVARSRPSLIGAGMRRASRASPIGKPSAWRECLSDCSICQRQRPRGRRSDRGCAIAWAENRRVIMKHFIAGAAIAALSLATTASAQTNPFIAGKCEATSATFENIRLPRAVLANGKTLSAGTYQIRITTEHPTPAGGQSPTAECWIEFVKGATVVGREIASVIEAGEIAVVAEGPRPLPNESRVDALKGGEYFRVWLNRADTHYIVNMPVAQ